MREIGNGAHENDQPSPQSTTVLFAENYFGAADTARLRRVLSNALASYTKFPRDGVVKNVRSIIGCYG